MSILIKGMEMPGSCEVCELVAWNDEEGLVCPLTGVMALNIGRQDACPLVEVVHCKDCAFMEHGVKDSNEVWCCWHDSRMMEYDFCSRGKEKEHEPTD